MKKLVVVTCHGMGDHPRDYAAKFSARINAYLYNTYGKDPNKIEWVSIWYSDVTSGRQGEYFDRMVRENRVRYTGLRKYFLNSLADAVAYNGIAKYNDDRLLYDEIHGRVSDTLTQAYEDRIGKVRTDVAFIGYSLGSVILSNYVWDVQHKLRGHDQYTAFDSLESLKLFMTFGSTLPMFSFAHREAIPIKVANWYNYYDKDDVFGYPLKTINEKYDRAVDQDIEIKVSDGTSLWSRLTSRTPLVHDKYFDSKRVAKDVAKRLSNYI